MTTSAISSATAAAASQSAAAANAGTTGKAVISSDFQTFLEMLTVQMKNQDPLNPIDSSDYAVQLATFSSVEQQVLTNDLLNGLITQVANSGIAQLAGWVGMEARSAAPARFDGSPLTLLPQVSARADEAWLVVRDASGREVARDPLAIDTGETEWAGTDASGAPLPTGLYTFEVENHAEGTLLGNSPVEHYARITEAQNAGGGLVLVLEGGAQVSSAEISALRNPA